MELDFKVYKLKPESSQHKQLVKSEDDNQFIIVGEDNEMNCYNAHHLGSNSIDKLINEKLSDTLLK